MASTIVSVSQAKANSLFTNTLVPGQQVVFRDLKTLLETNFPGINSNQCSGLIHRAHTKNNAVLQKNGEHYQLRPRTSNPNNVPVQGLEKVKAHIRGVLKEIQNIPVDDFKEVDDFSQFKKIQTELKKLIDEQP